MRIAIIACTIAFLLPRVQAQSQTAPIPIKVVVVTMFERGEDTGDTPGEFQLWVEREHLDQVVPLAAGYHHLRLNKNGVLGLLTGVGTAKAAASVMALGTDPRFDLSKAYWVVAGVPRCGRITWWMEISRTRWTRAISRGIGRRATFH